MRAVRGYSLIELLAVLVVMSTVIGVVTLNVFSLTEHGRLMAACDEVMSIYRLASFDATRSGTPRMMLFASDRYFLRKPALVDGNWIWKTTGEFSKVRGAQIVRVDEGTRDRPRNSSDRPWQLIILPGEWLASQEVQVSIASGRQASVRLCACPRDRDIRPIEDSDSRTGARQ